MTCRHSNPAVIGVAVRDAVEAFAFEPAITPPYARHEILLGEETFAPMQAGASSLLTVPDAVLLALRGRTIMSSAAPDFNDAPDCRCACAQTETFCQWVKASPVVGSDKPLLPGVSGKLTRVAEREQGIQHDGCGKLAGLCCRAARKVACTGRAIHRLSAVNG